MKYVIKMIKVKKTKILVVIEFNPSDVKKLNRKNEVLNGVIAVIAKDKNESENKMGVTRRENGVSMKIVPTTKTKIPNMRKK